MKLARVISVTLCTLALPLLLGPGCPTDPLVPEGVDDLTSLEKEAIVAAYNAPGALAAILSLWTILSTSRPISGSSQTKAT